MKYCRKARATTTGTARIAGREVGVTATRTIRSTRRETRVATGFAGLEAGARWIGGSRCRRLAGSDQDCQKHIQGQGDDDQNCPKCMKGGQGDDDQGHQKYMDGGQGDDKLRWIGGSLDWMLSGLEARWIGPGRPEVHAGMPEATTTRPTRSTRRKARASTTAARTTKCTCRKARATMWMLRGCLTDASRMPHGCLADASSWRWPGRR